MLRLSTCISLTTVLPAVARNIYHITPPPSLSSSELDSEQARQRSESQINMRTRDNCSITAGLDNDIDQDFPLLGFGNKELRRDSLHSATPLLPEIHAPDPFIIEKSRQLNKRVTLNVGGVRHEVMWSMLEQVPRSRLGKLAIAGTHEQILTLCDTYRCWEGQGK